MNMLGPENEVRLARHLDRDRKGAPLSGTWNAGLASCGGNTIQAMLERTIARSQSVSTGEYALESVCHARGESLPYLLDPRQTKSYC